MIRLVRMKEASIPNQAQEINRSFFSAAEFKKIERDVLAERATIAAKIDYMVETVNRNLATYIKHSEEQFKEAV